VKRVLTTLLLAAAAGCAAAPRPVVLRQESARWPWVFAALLVFSATGLLVPAVMRATTSGNTSRVLGSAPRARRDHSA